MERKRVKWYGYGRTARNNIWIIQQENGDLYEKNIDDVMMR